MNRARLILTFAGLLAASVPVASAGAQGRGRGSDGVPEGHRPPAGMCRIWIDGVPPGQQPAPTDCTSALRNRPSNGRVIFGEEPRDKAAKYKKDDRKRDRGDDVYERRGDRGDRGERGERGERGDDRRDERRDDGDDDRGGASGTLPEMVGGVLAGRGVRTADVARLLGRGDVVARTVDADRDGVPERVTWHDARSGALVQTWVDRDRDGRADRVEFYRDGKRVRTLGAP